MSKITPIAQNDADFAGWLTALQQGLLATRQRALVMVQGEQDWARRLIVNALPADETVLWAGDGANKAHVSARLRDATRFLGSEFQWLVINCYSGFDADGFGALTGTLRGGGVLFIIVPPDWPDFADPERHRLTSAGEHESAVSGRFYHRFLRLLSQREAVYQISPDSALPRLALPTPDQTACLTSIEPPYASEQQRLAVEAVCHVVTGHRRRPLVLSADRGRGKSAALGLAAARLAAMGRNRILVTAPSQQAASTLLRHASPAGECVHFVAPDELLQQLPVADLVMVDEAAAIPLPMLEQILQHYSRVVFSTTIHGYEGTGRGFALKFRQTLDRITPGWHSMHLSTPIRWTAHDRLEPLVFDLLMMDAEPATMDNQDELSDSSIRFETLNRDALLDDEPTLRQLYGLLVQAHYRTTPADLRYLLDAPGVMIAVLRQQDVMLAVALVGQEGGFDHTLAGAIAAGQRRPRGHLVAQSLAVHAGLVQAPTLRYGRVIRLAVHPQRQGQGLGSELVAHVAQSGSASAWDALAVSYAVSPALLRFWSRAGFQPVRIGFHREARSGTHAMMMLRPLTAAGEDLVSTASTRLAAQLPDWLLEALQDLDANIVPAVLAMLPASLEPLAEWERDEIGAFVDGQRGYENCLPVLRRWLLRRLHQTVRCDELQHATLLIERLLQLHSWPSLARRHGLVGKAGVLARLRQAVARLTAAAGQT